MDQLPRLGKRVCRGILFLWVLGMGYVILLWHSLSLPYNYSRYLDDLLNMDNIQFEHMVHRIYPAELQLNKANASDIEAAFLDLNLSIHNDTVSTKIYDKQDDFNFDIVNFPFLDGGVPLMVYIYLNLFALPEHLCMLLTSIIVTNS